MPNDRVDAALLVIEALAGEDDRKRTETDLRKFNLAQVDQALSIGGFRGPFKSEPETYRRSLVRAVLLAKIAKGGTQLSAAPQAMSTLLGFNSARLQRELLSQFPYKPYRGNFEKRREWAPDRFTSPERHTTAKYMYLVHTLMRDASKVADYNLGNDDEMANFNKLQVKFGAFSQVSKKNPVKPNLLVDFFAQYLDDPTIIRQNIISSSVISEAKHSTYYPVGYIMRVPPECIYVTSPRDLGIANRTTDIMAELQRVHAGTQKTILSPEEVLAQTKQAEGNTGYNEVVVVGTAPEGKQVDVIGLFVKTDTRGNMYVPQSTPNEPYVNARAAQLVLACSRKFHLPIVKIPDGTSAASNTPWAFDVPHEGPPQATVRPRAFTI